LELNVNSFEHAHLPILIESNRSQVAYCDQLIRNHEVSSYKRHIDRGQVLALADAAPANKRRDKARISQDQAQFLWGCKSLLTGDQAAGLLGAAATMIGIMLPSTTLAFAASRWGHARKDWRAVRAFKAGMAPITIALLISTGWILTVQTPGWPHMLLTAVAALLAWRTRLHLLWMIAAGALLGGFGLV
jgi:hypothetical protein